MNFKKQQLKGVEIHGDSQVGTRTVNILMGEHAGEYVRGDIMDANAVIQAFDELKGNVDTNHDTLEELVNEIHANTENINNANTLIQKVDAESKARDENETSARSSKDTELENSIAKEKTRALNKEKEISDKLAIVDGDSNTEGSFRKAIAYVIADLDTKANTSDVLLKKSASGGYYIEENSNELGLGAFAEGESTASGKFAHAEGRFTTASGERSHAEGDRTIASRYSSHAEGKQTTASGENSHAEGQQTTASGNYGSHAEGQYTTASGDYGSHAEGSNTTASGDRSHAEGSDTTASGFNSHAEGSNTTASGIYSHAEGNKTIASGYSSHANGSNNIENKNAIHSVGIGNDTTRKNAEYIYVKNNQGGSGLTDDPKNGYKYLVGIGGYDGISTDNSTYKSVQEVIADLTARIEQLETKVRALESANTPA